MISKQTFRTLSVAGNISLVVLAIVVTGGLLRQILIDNDNARSGGSQGQPSLSAARNAPPPAMMLPAGFPQKPGAPNSLIQSDQPEADPDLTGKTLPVQGVDFKANNRTLVTYLSTTCHYCNDSAPFYKKLVEKYGASKNVKMVAIVTEGADTGAKHLETLGVKMSTVGGNLSSVGVMSTPTVLLVDENGKVIKYWVGQLPPAQEKTVYAALDAKS